jgi:hypothetical protein
MENRQTEYGEIRKNKEYLYSLVRAYIEVDKILEDLKSNKKLAKVS